MKVRILIIACIVAGVGVQAQETLPQGRWTVKQVTVEKSTDENVQTVVYNTAAEMQVYPLPVEWEIKDAQTIVWHFYNGTKQVLNYSLEGENKLWLFTTTRQAYQYSVSGNTMTVITINDYKQSLHTGHTEYINEKWTIVLQRK